MSKAVMSKLIFLIFGTIVLCSVAKAEDIGGSTCIYTGSTYQYSIISLSSSRSYTWCITGGTIVGSSGCSSGVGYNAYIVQVVWNPGTITRALTLTWSGGSPSSSGSATLYPYIASTFQGGSITSSTSQTVNYNTAPGTITCSPASGGVCSTTTYSYQWQSSPDNVTWTNISGAISQNYSPGVLTTTTYFRRVAASSAVFLFANSNFATVFVNPQFLPGSITTPVSSPINYNTAPGQIVGTIASGGNCSGTFIYQWESSTNNVTFTAISGATSQNYIPSTLTQTTYFRRKVSCGTEMKYSNTITISVAPQLFGGYINPSTVNIAYNTSPGQISCTAASGGSCGSSYTYQWESSLDNITYTPVSGATAQNYTPGNLTNTTSYRRKSSCGSEVQYSNVTSIVVMQLLVPGSISPANITINYNESPGLLSGTVSAGGNCANYTYLWESSVDNINYTTISGATSQNYTPANLTGNMFYKRRTTCGSETGYSNIIAISVNQPFEPGILVPFSQIIASGTSPALLTANSASGGGCNSNYTYQWQKSTNGTTFTDISGASGLTYNAGNLTATTHYRRRTTCGSGNHVYTNISTITVGVINTTAINSIKVREITKPGVIDASSASAITDAYQVKQTTQYFDGGRLFQTVNRRITPLQKDLVLPTTYDELGRETVNYLPYVSTANTGDFKSNAISEQYTFNNTSFAGEQYYYAQTQYEPSPLNRLSLSTAPGANWIGSNRGGGAAYFFNTITDAVRIWNVTIAASGGMSSYASPGTYEAGQLYKTISSDEHGKQVIEFKDKEGKIILKKVQLTANGDDGTGSNYTGWLCTYYLYDKLSNLRCVVQPRGVELISSNWLLNNSTILAEQCFRYEYDERKRMIIKKVPGAAVVYMVYDEKDRLVMMQDGKLRVSPAKWLVTKYDNLNRPTETGLWTNATSFTTHLSTASLSSNYPITSSNYDQLTISHYDDYTNIPGGLTSNFETTWATHFEGSYNSSPVFAQQQVATKQTRGMITWTQTRVLTSGTFIYALNIYDDRERPIQVKSTNITGGADVVTMQYNWNGQPIRTVQKQEKVGGPAQNTVVVTKYSYDHTGRMQQVDKKVQNTHVNSGSMPGTFTTIAKNEYNELGQLKKKDLGNKPGAGTPLSKSEYLYNIRGWLLSLNKDYLSASSNNDQYFGFEMAYDKNPSLGTFVPQYNGNISGMLWKSEGDQAKRKYEFSYDAANRLLKGDFRQYVSGSGPSAIFNTSAGIDFSIGGDPATGGTMKYDANGNITQMWQTGLKFHTSSVIDKLAYTYTANSNKLHKVFDNVTPTAENGMLGDFKDGSNGTGNDYTYDVNGNLTTDNNKSISSITYNHLNLPMVITVTGKGTITYTYDASGSKLRKTVAETGATVVHAGTSYTGVSVNTTTTYLGGAIFESRAYPNNSTLNTALGYIDRLQFVAHEEGRIRVKPTEGGTTGTFSYDYFLKDHLGNVRMVLTEEQRQDKYPVASLETSKVATEDDYYTIDNTRIADKSSVAGTPALPTYTNDNGIGNNPSDPSFEASNSNRLYKLHGSVKKLGLGITLKVMAGDRIDVHGKSFWNAPNTGGSGANVAPLVLDLLNALLGSPGGSVTGGHTGSSLNGAPAISTPLGTYIGNSSRDNPGYTTRPKAFVNYIFFDEQFRMVSGGFSAVSNTAGLKDHFSELQNLSVIKNGYVYIYASNESPVDVFFDNLQVVHTRGPILEETHYYPFGLTMAGISSKAAGSTPNKKKFVSQEFDDDLDWNTYQFRFRTMDPQIGRFLQIDPLAPQYVHNSTYAYAENDVIRAIDLEGLEKYIVTFRAFIPRDKERNPDPTRNDKYYAGDNRREYQANATNYRTSQSVNVDFDNNKMTLLQNIATSSTGLDKNGKPITSSSAGKAGTVQGNVDAFEKGADNAVIKFDTHASNKLSAAAPVIDGILNLTITPNEDGSFNFSLKGATDGFPAFEMWVTDDKGNSYLLFNRNPIESGENPGSLFPPMEHKYDYKGNSKSATKGPVVKFSATKNSKEEDER